MTNKKLGLLLCPLLPLTAIGIVEVAGAITSMSKPADVHMVRETREVQVAPPVVHYSAPPPPSLPAPEPAPLPTAPRTVTSD